jgi:hypothetical protein
LLAGCAALAHIDLFYAMILLNAMALTATAFMFYAFAGLFSHRAGPRVAGMCVLLFAMNGWFYLFYPLRLLKVLVGDSRGAAVMRELFPWQPLGHDTALRLLSIEGGPFMFLDKFMLGTAFSLTFSLTLAVLFLLAGARRGVWSARHDVAFVACIAGTMLLHVVTGATVVIATLLVLALLMIVRATPAAGGPSYARLAAWTGLGLALTVPYLLSTTSPGGSATVSLGLQPRLMLGVLSGVLPALVLALVFLRGGSSHRDGEVLGARLFSELSLSATGILVLWTGIVLVMALTVDLVTSNETKFVFLAHLSLAALAVGGLERWWDDRRARRVLVLAVLSATLPLHMLYFHHAVRDASVDEETPGQQAAYAWIRTHTPPDAVFIDESDRVRIPVRASRDLYWGTEVYAFNWGYDPEEMRARRLLRDAVYSIDGLSDDDRLRLEALGRPVYVIYQTKLDEFTDDGERFLSRPGFKGRFTAERVSVFEVDPSARAGED